MPRDGSGTRREILDTAMRLFVDQGYDKTSLREIAESVGVTKAALYYHFRTKDDIVRAAMADYYGTIGDVVDWLETVPAGKARDVELVDRLRELFDGPLGLAMRFSQANPTVMNRDEFHGASVTQLQRLVRLVAGPEAAAGSALRATLAFGALVLGTIGDEDAPFPLGSPEDRADAGRVIALELLAGIRAASPAPAAT
ncbi:TetR family transcriptional regulator [Luteimicrobium xylanilyticum]|uniref:HTH-type transcriptional regulator AcrR n=1 Tax=Luteimicrobium xylanilyticum TaxID=1133546 RepID=A0A5P9Q6G8_9MICO|nr:TetR/AcrR family transcriptional regulator [Luteimicrobium xylanilyticum]QFU96700.1 HTH-type transcriptional regulator AcrR [Luteimicrobium xylanilyticum]